MWPAWNKLLVWILFSNYMWVTGYSVRMISFLKADTFLLKYRNKFGSLWNTWLVGYTSGRTKDPRLSWLSTVEGHFKFVINMSNSIVHDTFAFDESSILQYDDSAINSSYLKFQFLITLSFLFCSWATGSFFKSLQYTSLQILIILQNLNSFFHITLLTVTSHILTSNNTKITLKTI